MEEVRVATGQKCRALENLKESTLYYRLSLLFRLDRTSLPGLYFVSYAYSILLISTLPA